MDRREILQTALETRNNSILMYQINIDNYTLALEHMANMSQADREELAEYAQRIQNLLVTERLEQKKEKVIRDVIAQQLAAMDQTPPA